MEKTSAICFVRRWRVQLPYLVGPPFRFITPLEKASVKFRFELQTCTHVCGLGVSKLSRIEY